MPRQRIIKPSFWSDGKIVKLSRDCRLFYIALWNFADDEGRIDDDPLQLKMLIFPADADIGESEVSGFLESLVSCHRLTHYSVRAKQYFFITRWSEHQKVKYPSISSIPAPDDVFSKLIPPVLPQSSPSVPPVLPNKRRGEEGRGVKRRGVKSSQVNTPPLIPPEGGKTASVRDVLNNQEELLKLQALYSISENDLIQEIEHCAAWWDGKPQKSPRRPLAALHNWLKRRKPGQGEPVARGGRSVEGRERYVKGKFGYLAQ